MPRLSSSPRRLSGAAGRGSTIHQGLAYLGQQPRGALRFSMIGIFFPVDRRHMGWIFIKVGSPDSKLRVRVDPVSQFFTCGPSLCIIVTIYADKISREPVAITAAKTAAMV